MAIEVPPLTMAGCRAAGRSLPSSCVLVRNGNRAAQCGLGWHLKVRCSQPDDTMNNVCCSWCNSHAQNHACGRYAHPPCPDDDTRECRVHGAVLRALLGSCNKGYMLVVIPDRHRACSQNPRPCRLTSRSSQSGHSQRGPQPAGDLLLCRNLRGEGWPCCCRHLQQREGGRKRHGCGYQLRRLCHHRCIVVHCAAQPHHSTPRKKQILAVVHRDHGCVGCKQGGMCSQAVSH